MAKITAAAVKSLRDRTGLPMMDCKQALKETDADEDAAVEYLRKKGLKTLGKRQDRATAFGRMGIYADLERPVGAMVELLCESAPVAKHEEFVQFSDDLAKQLALGPGAASADELLDQPSPSTPDKTLREVKEELFNRMREVFNVGRICRIDGKCAGYSHNAGTVAGVLVEMDGEGDVETVGKDVAMHVTAMRPKVLLKEDLPEDMVSKEREILAAAARGEGKPENIVEKMVEGRLRDFYANHALAEQPFVKEPKQTVGKHAKQNGLDIKQFVHWELEATGTNDE
jgi:elongation factor Ts